MANSQQNSAEVGAESVGEFDAIIVGAGLSGVYMLHRLRELGFSARVLEEGDGVGGTWYWNRYPGARCDVISLDYSYSFSEDLQQEWEWTERYPSQPEMMRYINHVVDRFDLRRDIQLETRVTEAHFDEETDRWDIRTDGGELFTPRFCIMATGCLSAAQVPDFEGFDTFEGDWYHTSDWPHEGVDFSGKRVAVIGTGSTGIQATPVIAEEADLLTVFQRTANFSVPAQNAPQDPEIEREVKANYAERRRQARQSLRGYPVRTTEINDKSALEVTPEEREREYQNMWNNGGPIFTATFADLIRNQEANDTAAEFVRDRIREKVKDPATAEKLSPYDHPLGTKRICVDTDYYETFNQENVSLVDVRESPIEEITPNGLRTRDGQEYELDAIVFATGFNAMTGALLNIDIRGKGGRVLEEKWKDGPRTYLGVSIAGFPNLFTITGPGSPSVLTNMITSIEQHVEWISDFMEYAREHGLERIEATFEAQDEWVAHVNEVANNTLFPKANSWYMGANIPGKPQIFMPYAGGVANYGQKCDEVAANEYEGFTLTARSTERDGALKE